MLPEFLPALYQTQEPLAGCDFIDPSSLEAIGVSK
jgi:hypothetical protein